MPRDRQAQRPEERASQSGGTGDYLDKIDTSLSADEGPSAWALKGFSLSPEPGSAAGGWREGGGRAEAGLPSWELDRPTRARLLPLA